MAEQLHKGWLNTRENEKFAPATLATQIYNEDGTSFYRTVSNYIEAQNSLSDALEQLATVDVADLKADLQAETEARAAKDQELENQLQYFNGSADNALYIIDKNANVIAYVDGSGVNSTDFTIPTSGIRLSNIAAHVNDLQDSVESILTKLAYFDGAADDAFFIIDNNKNVIAYIDGSGVHSTNFFTTETDFNSLVARINAIETTDLGAINQAIKRLQETDDALGDSIETLTSRLSYFNGDADDTFYIIDKNTNVIACVKEGGVYSVDFHPKDGRSVKELDSALKTHQNEFNNYKSQQSSLDNQQNNSISALNDSVEALTNKLSYFNGDADDAFYIIDKNQNVIAYIKEGGVYSVDFIPNEGRTHKELDDAFDIHVEQYGKDKEAQAETDKQQSDSISALSDSVEKLSAYFNADADDTFYIIDKNKNVIAYIRDGGVYSTNFTLKDGRNLVTLYDDYERILANAETYNTFDAIETWIEGAIETLRAHGESIGALEDSVEAVVAAVGLPSDNANYPGYETMPANLYEAVVENRTDINVLNGEVTQEGSVAKAIDDLHKEILDGASADYQTLKKVETAIEDAKDRLDVAEGEIDAIQGLIGESTDNTNETLLGKININAQNIASNDEDIEALQTNTQYFNGAADDTLYIVDQTDEHNVIALVNKDGVKSIDFTSKTAGSFNAAAAKLDNLQQFVEDFNAEVSIPDTPEYDDGVETLYGQVLKNKADIAIINGDQDTPGSINKAVNDLHTAILDGASVDYQTLKKVETAIESAKDRLDVAEGEIDDIQELIGESSDTTDTTLLGKININAQNIASNDEDISELQQNTQYFNGAADDALYIVDQSEDQNVIAVINDQGVKSIDFTTPEAGLNATAASLAALTDTVEDLSGKVGIPEEPDYDNPEGSLYQQVIKNKEDIATLNGDTSVKGSVSKAVNDLKNSLIGDATTYKTFGSVEDQIGLDYTSGQDTVKGKIQTNIDDIKATSDLIGDYPTATGFPTNKTIFQLIEANWQEIEVLTAGDTTPGSVAYQIAQVVAGADASFDTLKEIADWIIAHPTDVAEMWAQINKNKNDIESIFDEIGEKTIDAGQTIHQRIDDNDADINSLEEKVQYFDGNGDDTLYIVDNTADHNIVAYVNKTGIHAINFTSHKATLDPETNTAPELENFNNLVTRVGQAEDDIDALEQIVENHVADAATKAELEGVRSNLQGQIDNINTDIGSDTVANSIKGRIKVVENEIGTNTTEGSIKYRITTTEGEIDALQESSEDHADRISALETDATDNPKALQSDFKNLYDQVNTGDNSLVKQIAGNDTDILELQTNSATKAELQAIADALETHKGLAATDAEVEVIRSNLQDQIDDINTEIGDPTTSGRTIWPTIEKIESWAGNLNATGTVTARLDAVENKANGLEDAIGEATDAVGAETVYGRINAINDKIKYFDGNADTAFYIIDKNSNVIAYINETGLVIRNVHLQYYNADGELITYPHLEQLAQWLGLEDDTVDDNTIFGRLLKAESDIDDLFEAVETVNGQLGIPASPNEPDYKNPKTNGSLDTQTLYAQTMANQAAVYDIYKENGELDALANRLLYIDPNTQNDLNYSSIESIGETLGLSTKTTTAGDTVFDKIETLRESIETLQDWSEGDQSWREGMTSWSGYNDVTYKTNYETDPANLAAAVKQNREDINRLNNSVATDATGKAVSQSIDERIAAHNNTIMGDVEQLNTFGKVEDAIVTNEGQIDDIKDVIGEKAGGELADSGSETIWSNIEDINRVFNNDSDDTIYVVDKDKNVVAYFNQSGLTTTNVVMSNSTLNHSIRGLGYNEETIAEITFEFDI